MSDLEPSPAQERAIEAIQKNRDLGTLDSEARRIAEEVRQKRNEEVQRAADAVARLALRHGVTR